ncbi:FemAB family protein [Paucihalobacter sp.]|uniref:FemAB family protein n=1 Tax=Paucihalobacter sp. TaxID=2850405 RepID=UPI002FE055FE
MTKYHIQDYKSQNFALWNQFVQNSENATFLFERDFMEYHSDRFVDASFMIFQDDELIAICPANKNSTSLYSHQGLTYGGIVFKDTFNLNDMHSVLITVFSYLKTGGYSDFVMKSMPAFYGDNQLLKFKHQLIKNKANTVRTDMVLAIDYNKPLAIHKTKLKHYQKNLSTGFEIKETNDFSDFWDAILTPRLLEKHNAIPVHSLEEITYLKSKYPRNIKQYNLYLDEELLAGITLFDTGKVVKSQYGATSLNGEKTRAIEFLFLHLIYKYQEKERSFFSMGTVTEQNELGYNQGLLKQKEELGCDLYLQDFLSLKIS